MEAIDYLDLVVSDLERSLEFYRGLLGPFGYVRESVIEGERAERVVYLGRAGGWGSVSLRERPSDQGAQPYDRYALGLHHLAFAAGSRAVVDERAAWLRELGAIIESGPSEYGYTPGYYAVFFYDPGGIKLEIVHRPQERDVALRVEQLARRVAVLESQLKPPSYGGYQQADSSTAAVDHAITVANRRRSSPPARLTISVSQQSASRLAIKIT